MMRRHAALARGMVALMAVIMSVALAACGGSSNAKGPQAPAKSGTSSKAAPSPSCTIPQNNGGDHDADNNGGPDDGDGCDV